MTGPQDVVDGMVAVLVAEHGAEIDRLAAAACLGQATRIWYDEAAQKLRFEVVEDFYQKAKR
jgi:hypothetical protein